jgi:CHAT domain-containing protein
VLWSRLEAAEIALGKAGRELADSSEELARLELELHKPGRGAQGPTSRPKQEDLGKAKERRNRAMASYTAARLEHERLLSQARRSVTGLERGAWSLGTARRALPAHSVFIAWEVGERQSFIFVVPSDSSRTIFSEVIEHGRRALARRVESLREQLAANRTEAANLTASSRALCRVVLPPRARNEVERSERVVLCPDGPLWDLPFAALAINADGTPRWLGLEKPLSYSQSLAVLLADCERDATSQSSGRALVVGDPLYPPSLVSSHATKTAAGGLSISRSLASEAERSALFPDRAPPPRLPASADEAREVAALYGAEPLLGEAATEAAVRTRITEASVVHLATHGYFNPRLPMSSGVLLSPPAGPVEAASTSNDGALQAREFGPSLPLRANLVVLSACETGRGAKVKGEGLVGLTRALQGAGARSVVATLWKVPDNSTAWLMLAFHRELTQGVAKDEALRRAMAITAGRATTSAPYFWAACFLTGDPDHPIDLAR